MQWYPLFCLCCFVTTVCIVLWTRADINLDKVLSEEREKEEAEAGGSRANVEAGEAAEGDAEDGEAVEDQEDVDENVDDDYADTYFDNGENFLDPDDDALEEGAIF